MSIEPGSSAAVALLQRLWEHSVWADDLLWEALQAESAPPEAWREYSHVLGAEETWLSRLCGRVSTQPVWPLLDRTQAAGLREWLRREYARYMASLSEAVITSEVSYANSAGQQFSTAVGDILSHVALHGQYHRGKVNLLLRQAGQEPVPTDFISFARGVPAAVTPVR